MYGWPCLGIIELVSLVNCILFRPIPHCFNCSLLLVRPGIWEGEFFPLVLFLQEGLSYFLVLCSPIWILEQVKKSTNTHTHTHTESCCDLDWKSADYIDQFWENWRLYGSEPTIHEHAVFRSFWTLFDSFIIFSIKSLHLLDSFLSTLYFYLFSNSIFSPLLIDICKYGRF